MSRVNVIALLLFLLIAGWMLTLGAGTVTGIRERALTMAGPLVKARDQVQRAGEELAQPRLTREQLVVANERLERQVQEAAINEKALEKLYEENALLKEALRLRQSERFELVAAEVISRETEKWYHTVIIDKGRAQGIGKGDTVMVDRGLVGKISVVGEEMATVLLLTDEACKVTAQVVGTSQRGILEGQGAGLAASVESVHVAQGQVEGLRGGVNFKPYLRLKHLEQRANVQPGMRVESSGAGRVFPGGIEVGTIVSVRAGEITTEALVEPAVDFRNLRFVFVITGSKEGGAPP